MKTEITIGADIKDFEQKMAKVRRSMNSMSSNIQQNTSALSGMLSMLVKIGKATTLIGAPATFVASERSFRKFEHGMMEAFTLLPKANKQAFAQMKKDALGFSEEFGVNTEEVAKGMYQSLSSGIAPGEPLMKFMKVAQESAIAGVTDLKTSVDALTNIMNAYGQQTYPVEYIADILFKGVTMSKLTFEELSRYMYQAIPTAASLKVELSDLVGAISALSATGTLTRVGATQFRQFLVELQDIGSNANTAFLMGTKGVTFQDYLREGGRLVDIMKILRKSARMSQTDMSNLFSSIEAGNAAKTMDNFERFDAFIEQLDKHFQGSKNKAYGRMMDTLQKQFDRVKASFFNFFTRLGDVLEPAFRTMYEQLDRLTDYLREDLPWDEWSKGFERMWKTVLNIAKAGSDVLQDYLFNALKMASVKAYKEIRSLFFGVGDALARFFALDSEELRSSFSALFDVAKSFGMKIVDGISDAIPYLIQALAPIGAHLLTMAQRTFERMTSLGDEDVDHKRLRETKIKDFGEKGTIERLRALERASGEETTEGIKLFIEKNKETFTDEPSKSHLLGQAGQEDSFLNHYLPAIVGGMGTDDIELEYRPFFDSARKLADALEDFDDSTFGKNISLPLAEDDKIESIREGKFDAKDISRAQNDILDAYDLVSSHRGGGVHDRIINSRLAQLQNMLNVLDLFEENALQMLYDSEVGKGRKPDVDMEGLRYADLYNENLKTFNQYSSDMFTATQAVQEQRDKAREQEMKSAIDNLKVEIGELYDKMGTFNIEEMPDDHPVILELDKKLEAFQAKQDAFHQKFGKGIKIEDPSKADYGVNDMPKSPPQEPYQIRGFFPQVIADSKQKVGGGGGAYSYVSVQERLLEQEQQLTDAVVNLTQQIRDGMPFIFEEPSVPEKNITETTLKPQPDTYVDNAETKVIPSDINAIEINEKTNSKESIPSDKENALQVLQNAIKGAKQVMLDFVKSRTEDPFLYDKKRKKVEEEKEVPIDESKIKTELNRGKPVEGVESEIKSNIDRGIPEPEKPQIEAKEEEIAKDIQALQINANEVNITAGKIKGIVQEELSPTNRLAEMMAQPINEIKYNANVMSYSPSDIEMPIAKPKLKEEIQEPKEFISGFERVRMTAQESLMNANNQNKFTEKIEPTLRAETIERLSFRLDNAGQKIEFASQKLSQVLDNKSSAVEDVYPINF